ncbi:MAG TPA: RecX family transcriptional regulator [Bacteroidia bacterium]|nr:RecX family transcriptional regulator [Bacteroidia bacterium]HNP99408.1 RecX family transcriptional regulator [Bacteroidia bacterium]
MSFTAPDFSRIYSKALKYCAYQERSQQEVRDKLYALGLHRREVEQAIGQLIADGFLKEERFAIAFAGGKFRMKKWGRIKIKIALREKKVSEPLIRQALNSIDQRDYLKTLQQVLLSKSKMIAEKDSVKKKYKVAAYAIQRGFEPDLVWELLRTEDVE